MGLYDPREPMERLAARHAAMSGPARTAAGGNPGPAPRHQVSNSPSVQLQIVRPAPKTYPPLRRRIDTVVIGCGILIVTLVAILVTLTFF
jgi:hypothetical protein